MFLGILIVVWILCGIFVFGATFADFQGEFPTIAADRRQTHLEYAAVMSAFGLVGAFVVLISTKGLRHGWKLR